MTLRLLSYNIRYGGVGREEPLAKVIRASEADLVVMQEATRPEVVTRLAAECRMTQWGARLGESLAWMSRVPVSGSVWHKPWLAKRSYIELTTGTARIYGVHLAAIHSNLTEQRRVWEVRTLLRALPPGFHVLTGDFNSIAPGEHFDLARLPQRLRTFAWATGGPIRWRTIRILLDAGYLDGYRLLHQDPGYTFPTWDPQIRLDYCMVRAATVLKRCDVMSGLPEAKVASDHFPLLSEIAMP